jgi:NlpC/P60 family putative phage cell wall peptidase
MNTNGREAGSKSHWEDTQIAEQNTKGPRAARPHAAETAAVQIQNLRDLRAAVVREAESWIGTPFHHAARVKGAGVDCLMLLAEIYERAGVAPHIDPPFYVPDWHLHRDAERYLVGLTRYALEIPGPPQGTGPLPGDIALFRFGRTFSHGAIVTLWPRLVHAYWSVGVVHGDATRYPLATRPVKFFSPFDQ